MGADEPQVKWTVPLAEEHLAGKVRSIQGGVLSFVQGYRPTATDLGAVEILVERMGYELL